MLFRSQPDVLLIAGDVFDNGNPSAASQELYFNFLHRVTTEQVGMQLVIIAGNHDSAARLEAPRALLARQGVEVRGVVKHTSAGRPDYDDLIISVHARGNEGEKAYVVAVPYLRDGDYTRGLNYSAGVTDFLQQAVAKAQAMRRPDEAVILLAHLYARGSEIAENSSERVVIGGAEMVVLEPLVDAVSLTLLGHIHKRECQIGRAHV